MVTQTSVQEDNTIRFGAGKLEYESDAGAWVDVGWFEDGKFGDRWEKVVLKGANIGTYRSRIKDHELFFEGALVEINWEKLAAIRGGIDTLDTDTGVEVTVTDEPHTLTGTTGVRLNHRMGTGAEVSTIVVEDSTTPTAVEAVRGTDYVCYQDGDGYTCIARIAGSTTITTGETVKVSYKYTPNAATILKSGGKTEIGFRRWRMSNLNEDSKIFQVLMKKGSVEGGLSIDLKSDDDGEPWRLPFAIVGVVDGTLPVGEQLFEIRDEQAP